MFSVLSSTWLGASGATGFESTESAPQYSRVAGMAKDIAKPFPSHMDHVIETIETSEGSIT